MDRASDNTETKIYVIFRGKIPTLAFLQKKDAHMAAEQLYGMETQGVFAQDVHVEAFVSVV